MVSWLLTGAPEQRYWQNRETANVGLDSSVGRAPARQSGGRRFKSRSSQFFFVHPNLKLKKRNACLHAVRHAVEKKIAKGLKRPTFIWTLIAVAQTQCVVIGLLTSFRANMYFHSYVRLGLFLQRHLHDRVTIQVVCRPHVTIYY